MRKMVFKFTKIKYYTIFLINIAIITYNRY